MNYKVKKTGLGLSIHFRMKYLILVHCARLKEELENNSLQHESSLASLRQKHNTVIADLGDQIDTLNKAKAK